MTELDEAKALVRSFPLTEELKSLVEEGCYFNGDRTAFFEEKEMSCEELAQSLDYLITLEMTKVEDESKVALGASKYKGLPHLPPDFTWPEDQYFLAQFNLAELHPLDRKGVFPKSGMLYFFFNPDGAAADVHHYDGPLDVLEMRNYLDAETLPSSEYFYEDFITESSTISFSPGYIFYIGGDAYDYRKPANLIPNELKQKIGQLLGCSLVDWDRGTRIFGRPHYWQGEDEMDMEDEEGHQEIRPEMFEEVEPEEIEEMLMEMGIGMIDDPTPAKLAEVVKQYTEERGKPKIMLFEDAFGEGNIHYWIPVEAAQKGDFSKCFVDYSGT